MLSVPIVFWKIKWLVNNEGFIFFNKRLECLCPSLLMSAAHCFSPDMLVPLQPAEAAECIFHIE